MSELDQEEQELLQAFEAGELRWAADFAERKAIRNTRKRCSRKMSVSTSDFLPGICGRFRKKLWRKVSFIKPWLSAFSTSM
ncbi:hypothetical protein SAMN05421690_100977 [Nitrosomonas sp. Nm51]|uniref:hypothetical protein n=1 Tax=Nitrosomonas sp. Nm51 TaxID=133720 RepID=UPI0008AC4BD7|nr:hypothetical protein [Nitrosomonas sp. Nm51]SER13682.1 hypothetical protein SAMN05421690_100977 [Nitrosomonas sp. Nm51]